MKVVVTGSSGRVGRALAQHLRADGAEVLGIDRAAGPETTLPLDLAAVDAEPALARALAGASALVHVAALHAPHVGQHPDEAFEHINVQATQRLWRLACAAGLRAVAFTSTTALYGAGTQAEAAGAACWVDEATLPAPQTVYHRSKLAAERWLQNAAAASGAPALRILRMGRCFAEPAPVMALHRLARGIDVRDVATAHAAALRHALAPGAARQALHVVVAATPFQRADAAGLWHDAPAVLRQRAPTLVAEFERRGWPLPARIDRVYDAARAMAELRWQPRHGWADAITEGCGDGAASG